MGTFAKRKFDSFGHFWNELRFIFKSQKTVRAIHSGKTLTDAFRERLFMAVTSVNRCRYCSFVHTRAALKAGVSQEELDGFLSRNAETVPDEERVAIIFAQHWVDSGGHPDPDAVEKLNTTYGPETAAAIQTAVRFINYNNLFGNTVDWLLHTLTFGRVGAGK